MKSLQGILRAAAYGLVAGVLLLAAVPDSIAEWPTSPTINVQVGFSDSTQAEAVTCPDGKGGAIIAWCDYRNGPTNQEIYAQHVSASGSITWTQTGVPVCLATKQQLLPVIASDGAGGAIIAWHDLRGIHYDIYAQRVDSTGTVRWTTDGVLVCGAGNHQIQPQIISDGAGGAIVAWDDARFAGAGVPSCCYAQRLGPSGAALWTADGVRMSTKDNAGGVPNWSICTDGNGGAYTSQRVVNYPAFFDYSTVISSQSVDS